MYIIRITQPAVMEDQEDPHWGVVGPFRTEAQADAALAKLSDYLGDLDAEAEVTSLMTPPDALKAMREEIESINQD